MTKADVLIIAQADPLSGGAGWVGAGLLGLVLLWLLMRHLPEQSKQLERMVATHEAALSSTIASQRADFLATLAQARLEFRESLERVMVQHERQSTQLAAAIEKDAQLTRQVILEARERHDGRQK